MAGLSLTLPPPEIARRAHLRYTSDDQPGLCRVTRGRRVVYVNGDGKPIRDPRHIARIRTLAIPPAWTNVWICPEPRGHIQATGRDARGRKQYIYHEDWHAHSGQSKFNKLRALGEALPQLRRLVRRHLALPGLPRKKVVATVIALLDGTLIRVGNEEYARANGSYGLTTLRNRHAQIHGPTVHLSFQGKSGKFREVDFYDRRVARIVRQCQELPGQQLFQYTDDTGRLRRVESADVNRYLRAATGRPFTAKDFRTWKATALVLERLHQESADSPTARQRAVVQALRTAAESLGNTATVCRKYYVHPQVIELFLAGKLAALCPSRPPRAGNRLEPYERLLLRLLRGLERKGRR